MLPRIAKGPKRVIEVAQHSAVKNMAKPDLICIGAQKAGTSWLYSVLNERPDVWVPPLKELHFFDHHFAQERYPWTTWHVKSGARRAIAKHVEQHDRIDLNYVSYLTDIGLRRKFSTIWYERIFNRARDGQLKFEATPEYSCITEQGVKYVTRFLPECKFIYMVRDPVERAASQMKMNIRRSGKTPLNRQDWVELLERPEIEERARYSEYVPRWASHFGPERLAFFPFQRIPSEPEFLLRDIEEFVGLTPFEYKTANRAVHQGLDIGFPAEIVDLLEEKFKYETEFVRDYFGDEFADLT